MFSTRSNLIKLPPRLIINADDFGLSKGINEEIIHCLKDGILTSVSLMTGGRAGDEAICLALNFSKEIGVGVHLTLDGEFPVIEPKNITSLVTKDGKFHLRPHMLFRLLKGQVSKKAVYDEWAAQIEKLICAGIRPDHLNGHGHIHIFPTLLPVVIELAQQFGIPAVRLPSEPWNTSGSFKRFPGRFIISILSKIARYKFKNSLKYPDYMLGFSKGGCYKETFFLEDLACLKNGDFAEAMFHPGPEHIDIPIYDNWHYNWKVDSQTLRSNRVKDFINKQGIKLVTFKDLHSR